MHFPALIFFDSLWRIWQSQVFNWSDLAIVALLVILEGVLSVDNAMVLGLLVRPLPPAQQKSALTYGLVGAIVLRLVVIVAAAWLMRWHFINLLGGLYLVYLAVKHFWQHRHSKVDPAQAVESASRSSFWWTIVSVELTDLAFAIDSILAAIALVSQGADSNGQLSLRPQAHPKLWVVFVGGMLGVILMRFAAIIFVRLLDRFPRMETAAYVLVLLVGAKLLAEYATDRLGLPALDFRTPRTPEFWCFWLLMAGGFVVGFIPRKHRGTPTPG